MMMMNIEIADGIGSLQRLTAVTSATVVCGSIQKFNFIHITTTTRHRYAVGNGSA